LSRKENQSRSYPVGAANIITTKVGAVANVSSSASPLVLTGMLVP